MALNLGGASGSARLLHDRVSFAHSCGCQSHLGLFDAHEDGPERLVLDLNATDDPLHGCQEGRFFHGYYDCYCYLPLYIFCGDHLLAAKLRQANIDANGRGGRRGGADRRADPGPPQPCIATRRPSRNSKGNG